MRHYSLTYGKGLFYTIYETPRFRRVVMRAYNEVCYLTGGTLHGRWEWMYKVPLGPTKFDTQFDESPYTNMNSLGYKLYELEQSIARWEWRKTRTIAQIPITHDQGAAISPKAYDNIMDIFGDDDD